MRLAAASGWDLPALPRVTPEYPLKCHLHFKVKYFTASGVRPLPVFFNHLKQSADKSSTQNAFPRTCKMNERV